MSQTAKRRLSDAERYQAVTAARERFLAGDDRVRGIRPEVATSWYRCREQYHVDPSLRSAPAASDQDEIESFAARRKRLQIRRKQARRSSRWTALILVLFAFNVALVGARSEVVRFFPQTASLFAAVGLPGQSAQPEI